MADAPELKGSSTHTVEHLAARDEIRDVNV